MHEGSCPMTAQEITDRYFMEHRAKLVEIAAFLDRLDRARGGAAPDFRLASFKKALEVVCDGQPQRARRVLDLFSDKTEEPIPSTAGMKGAHGAWPGFICEEGH